VIVPSPQAASSKLTRLWMLTSTYDEAVDGGGLVA
jgi:hypothetical protein